MQQAISAMDQEVDLITCGLHFGDDQLYDLLRAAKKHPRAKTLPFLVVHATDDKLSPMVRESIDIATKALGADQFVMLEDWRKEFGDEKAFAMLLATFKRFLKDRVDLYP
jgi:alpha-beta hydrolase superfamily lysophospholipase